MLFFSFMLIFIMFANGLRYVFVADFEAHHCQDTMKFEASHNLSN